MVVLLQLTVGIVSLQQDWKLARLPGWVWFIPVAFEVVLLAALGDGSGASRVNRRAGAGGSCSACSP